MTTSLETDPASLAKTWALTMKIACPYCGDRHKFQVRDAYADAVMSSGLIRGPL